MWSVIFRLLARFLGGAGRATAQVARFGRVAFTGLIKNRALNTLTQQEVRNAFAKVGLREAHNSHFISRLISRGPQFGINTLDDFARALSNGTAQAGRQAGTIEIVLPNGRAAIVVKEATGDLITFLPL